MEGVLKVSLMILPVLLILFKIQSLPKWKFRMRFKATFLQRNVIARQECQSFLYHFF